MSRKEPKPERRSEMLKPLIAFDTWFVGKTSENKLRSWQHSEIRVYFGTHGLSERETLEDFENCFQRFEGVR